MLKLKYMQTQTLLLLLVFLPGEDARVIHVDASGRVFPFVVLDRVLSEDGFAKLREMLHEPGLFFDGEGVTFPGKIALLDLGTIAPLVSALRGSKEVQRLYLGGVFDSRFMRGFASVMCGTGGPHKDDVFPSNTVPPAAVFYIDVLGDGDGAEERTTKERTGTSFFTKNDDDHSYTEKKRIVARQNRMILYPQNVWHNAWVSDTSLLDCTSASAPRRMAISLFFATAGGVALLKDAGDEDEVAKVQRRYSRKSVHWPNWPLGDL